MKKILLALTFASITFTAHADSECVAYDESGYCTKYETTDDDSSSSFTESVQESWEETKQAFDTDTWSNDD